MSRDVPLTLQAYRKLSAMAMPVTGLLAEPPAEAGQGRCTRRASASGAASPLSVSIKRAADLDPWRQCRRGAGGGRTDRAAAPFQIRILLTSGTVTSAAIVAKRFPSDVIHQYVPFDAPRYVARFLDHWQPSLALFIEIRPAGRRLILANAARRHSDGADQRPDVRFPLVPTLAARLSTPPSPRCSAKFDLLPWRSRRPTPERFSALGGARRGRPPETSSSTCQAPPADHAKHRAAAGTITPGPHRSCRRLHPCGRGGDRRRRASAAVERTNSRRCSP